MVNWTDGKKHRQWLVVLALVLAALGQGQFAQGHCDAGLILSAMATPVLVVALRAGRKRWKCGSAGDRPQRTGDQPQQGGQWGRTRIGAVLLALAGNVVALCLLWRDDASPWGCLLWLVSLGGGVLVFPSWSRPTCHSEEGAVRSETDRSKTGHGSLFFVALVLLLAAFLRLYRLHDLPPGVFIDETNAAMDALEILDGKHVSPFATGWFQTPTLYAYYMAGLFRLLGVSFLALKLASVLPGLLTVAGLYPLGRRTFGSLSALLGLFLLATARWHVHMSRWGWNALLPPLGQVLVAYLLLRGLETGCPRDFALAGLTLGLVQYTYLAARLIPLVLFLFFLHQVVTGRGFLRRHGANLLLFVMVALMAFAPLGLTYVKNPFLLTNRARQVSILPDLQAAGGLRPLWDNVVSHLLMFNYQGDANPRHNLPRTPMLDPFAGALLLPAAGYALYRWRDRRYALLSCWIAVTLLGGVFSAAKEAPQAYRTLGALPAVALLLGDLLARLWRRLLQPGSRVWRGLVLAGGIALLALSGYHNVQTYFVSYAQDPRTFWGFSPLETGVARTVLAALPTHDVYVVPKLVHFSSLRFATYRRPDQGAGGLTQPPYEPFSPLESLPLPSSSGRDALLVLETQYRSLVPFISHFYPEAEARLHRAPDGQALYVTVEIPGQALTGATSTPPFGQARGLPLPLGQGRGLPLPQGQGLLGQYFLGEAWQGEPAMRRVDPLLLFHWYGRDPLPGSFSVRWEGEILLPEDGTYFFALVGDDGVRLWLDGELVGQSLRPDASNAVEARRTLEAGPHSIRVEYFQRSGAKLIEFRWARPGAALELVPPEALRPPGQQGHRAPGVALAERR